MRTYDGVIYELCSSRIQCRADMEGAEIFTVYNHGTWKVLAFSEIEAE